MQEIELIKEEVLKPKLEKYKLPDYIVDQDFHINEITLKCKSLDQMQELNKALWEVPVYSLHDDENDQRLTRSYRQVPEGLCLPDQYASIRNNFKCCIPKDKEGILNIQLKNDDKSNELVGYPIIYNKQYMGYLGPNSVFNDSFLIKKEQNKGIHVTYNGMKRFQDDELKIQIYSSFTWKEILEQLK